jgi:hypothetical protein
VRRLWRPRWRLRLCSWLQRLRWLRLRRGRGPVARRFNRRLRRLRRLRWRLRNLLGMEPGLRPLDQRLLLTGRRPSPRRTRAAGIGAAYSFLLLSKSVTTRRIVDTVRCGKWRSGVPGGAFGRCAFMGLPQNVKPSSAGLAPERHFAPVIINGDCRGHILRSAKGSPMSSPLQLR